LALSGKKQPTNGPIKIQKKNKIKINQKQKRKRREREREIDRKQILDHHQHSDYQHKHTDRQTEKELPAKSEREKTTGRLPKRERDFVLSAILHRIAFSQLFFFHFVLSIIT
jgi:hypothetical protein